MNQKERNTVTNAVKTLLWTFAGGLTEVVVHT